MPVVVDSPAILIKRYGPDRFYEPERRRYVSLSDLRGWRRQGFPFVVIDAATGEDVTRTVPT